MFSTVDLQLSTIEFSDDLVGARPLQTDSSHSGNVDFAHELRARVDTTLENTLADGEFLPIDGNVLPPALDSIQVSHAVESVRIAPIAAIPLPGSAVELPGEPTSDQSSVAAALLTTEVLASALQTAATTDTNNTGRILAPPTAVTPNTQDVTRALAAANGVTTDLKDVPRVFTPPTAAAQSDIAAEYTPPIGHAAATAVNNVPRSVGRSARGDESASLSDSAKFPPLVSATPTDAQLDREATQETRQSPVLSLQQISAIGHGQPAAQAVSANPSVTGTNVSPFAADLELAAESISTPVRDSRWADRIGERLVMLAGGQQKTAEIRLTPAELGPLRVQISIDEGATNVTFQAHHIVTRDALEQAMPRLRELLAENGLTLGETSVSEQDVGERHEKQTAEAGRSDLRDAEEELTSTDHHAAKSRLLQARNGLVDTFA